MSGASVGGTLSSGFQYLASLSICVVGYVKRTDVFLTGQTGHKLSASNLSVGLLSRMTFQQQPARLPALKSFISSLDSGQRPDMSAILALAPAFPRQALLPSINQGVALAFLHLSVTYTVVVPMLYVSVPTT